MSPEHSVCTAVHGHQPGQLPAPSGLTCSNSPVSVHVWIPRGSSSSGAKPPAQRPSARLGEPSACVKRGRQPGELLCVADAACGLRPAGPLECRVLSAQPSTSCSRSSHCPHEPRPGAVLQVTETAAWTPRPGGPAWTSVTWAPAGVTQGSRSARSDHGDLRPLRPRRRSGLQNGKSQRSGSGRVKTST